MHETKIQNEESRLLDEATMHDVVDTITSFCGPRGELRIQVGSLWASGQRWARNRASMTDDQRNVLVVIGRKLDSRTVGAVTNQIDKASLKGAVDLVTYYAKFGQGSLNEELALEIPHWESKGIPVWSEKTFDREPAENGRAVYALTERSEQQGFLSAGYLESLAANILTYERDRWGRDVFRTARVTAAQCSNTVRHPKGTGSGWAGLSSFDFGRIDTAALANLAFDKCLKSLNPVRIEPGRYQTILEPQAVASFAHLIIRSLGREQGESGHTPFWLGIDRALNRGRSKLGLHVVDRRLSLYHDPEDPVSGTHVSEGVRKVEWIKDGVLTELATEYGYTERELTSMDFAKIRSSFVLKGSEEVPVEEMIHNTKRGLLLTRVSPPSVLDRGSLLCTGVTRDGLWLIENGKITKAVRNFRWTESPLFILNNVESIGVPVPVFTPNRRFIPFSRRDVANAVTTIVVPPLQVNDFSFTSTIDAI